MANPNIVNVTSIYGGNSSWNLSNTVTTTLLTVAADVIVKVNLITVANVDGTNAATCDVCIVKANATPLGITNYDISGTFYLAKTVNVPADDILVVLDKPIYLMATDTLEALASAGSDLDIFISFEANFFP